MTTEDSRRVEALVEEMMARLRPMCTDWPDDLFRDMVRSLALITVKYEHTGAPLYDRRGTERLVSEMKELLRRNLASRERKDESA